ncbi:MAG: electron transfer flavoprotein subunit beta/FixA family protein [Deltaproteobacteria bacterium]|nr:electron transfer flavoprotein subunit beta/FixA family protein [Deltaproteobacteria bacterium]MBW2635480.1 electron transfer flavoprotein subunit beta/FixA family protein [Deltaproteobacteria bacterium]MBW2675994.1 electron transfer flavoprotein subunit beta/FixA family protein [Deltaproteobacteria bacterium]
MKILVCVKQVPESEAPISIDEETGWVQIDGSPEYRMNRFDECAVEEAVLIKEALPGTVVDVITVGPERVEAVVRRAMGMGADNGAHILTVESGYVDAFMTAGAIAAYAKEKQYDLILAGAMSEDLMQGQVGPIVAAHLDIACMTSTVYTKLSADAKKIYVEREVEGGCREVGDIKLPALLTIQTGINTPRYPALSKLLRANNRELAVVAADASDPASWPQKLAGVALPEKTRDAVFLSGTAAKKAEQLLVILKERSLIA